MIISESWLREWVSPPISTDDLAELLTQAGLEVETVTHQTMLGDKVVVGEIIAIEKHPDADKLNICQVNVGANQNLTIVCGASNAQKGLVAPVALVGAVLPNGLEIGARKVRGVVSSGMICAASELELDSTQSDGLMALDPNAPIGELIDDYLALEDAIIDIDLTPDRGDCLSILGVAREVAAMSKADLIPHNIPPPVVATINDVIKVSLQAPKACPHYAGRIIKGINVGARTPDAIKEKLRKVGVRSISPVVDVTNFVMLELGQPMHAFDLNKIQSGINVRMATTGETLTLLDEQQLELDNDTLVIADATKPIALAGIMGGANSEIDENTCDILLESAFFSPLTIASKARQFGLHTDASHRYERGVDAKLQVLAIERATQLMLDIVGGECGPVIDQFDPEHIWLIDTIGLRPQRVRDLLGLDIEDTVIKQHLQALQMKVDDTSEPWDITRPSWRLDISGEHDLIEEVGRLEGLDKIEPNAPILRASPFVESAQTLSLYRLKNWLAGKDYREAVNYSFIDSKDQQAIIDGHDKLAKVVDIANPIASNMSQMRLSLLPGLLNVARTNEQRQHKQIRLYEMGNVFSIDTSNVTGVKETPSLAMVASGYDSTPFWQGQPRETDFFDVKGHLISLFDRAGIAKRIDFRVLESDSCLHPGRAADVMLDGKTIGFIGVLHPKVQQYFDLKQEYIVVHLSLQGWLSLARLDFISPSRFPVTTRDLALVVSEKVFSGNVLKEIQVNCGKTLKKCVLFDSYTSEEIDAGQKSLAFSLTFQSPTESLSSNHIDTIINNLLDILNVRFGAKLRD